MSAVGAQIVRGRFYKEVAVGDTIAGTMAITENHLAQGAALIADFNPLHVDDAFARQSRYGSRILHGVISSAILSAPVGMHFAGTAIAYLEHNARFLAPVRVGDTLELVWRVVAKDDRPRHGGGIVALEGEAVNQGGVVVVRASGRMLVGNTSGAR